MKQLKTLLLLITMIALSLNCPGSDDEAKKKEEQNKNLLVVAALATRSTTPTSSISYSGATSTTALVINSQMTSLSPTLSNFTATSYSVSPALPTGITLNTTTGVISGTPTSSVTTRTSYVVTAASSSSSVSVTLIFLIGSSGAFSCEFKGTLGGCTSTRGYSCTNSNTCYSALSSCQQDNTCLPN